MPSTIVPRSPVAVRHEQADRALHAQETRRRHGDRARQHALDHRLVQADGVEQLVEDAHEVVLRVVERLGRNRARVAEHVPGLLDHEAQRIAQHFRQVVPHQQRLVLVDGQPRVALAGGQRQADAALPDAVLRDELLALLVNAQPRVLQVDRIHGVPGHRHDDPRLRHGLLVRVAEHARAALAGLARRGRRRGR